MPRNYVKKPVPKSSFLEDAAIFEGNLLDDEAARHFLAFVDSLDIIVENDFPLYAVRLEFESSDIVSPREFFLPLTENQMMVLKRGIVNQLEHGFYDSSVAFESLSAGSGETLELEFRRATKIAVYMSRQGREALNRRRDELLRAPTEPQLDILSMEPEPFQRPISTDVVDLEVTDDEDELAVLMENASKRPKLVISHPVETIEVLEEGIAPEDDGLGHLSDVVLEESQTPPFSPSEEGEEIDADDDFMGFPPLKRRQTRRGKFFAYEFLDDSIYNLMESEFRRWQVVKETIVEEGINPMLKDNCFVYALKMALSAQDHGLSDEEVQRLVLQMYKINNQPAVSTVQIKKLINNCNIDGFAIKMRFFGTGNPKTKVISQYGIDAYEIEEVPETSDASQSAGSKRKRGKKRSFTKILHLCHVSGHYLVHEKVTNRAILDKFGISHQSFVTSGALLDKAIKADPPMVKQMTWNYPGIVASSLRNLVDRPIDVMTFCEEAFDRDEFEPMKPAKERNHTSEEQEVINQELAWFCDFETYTNENQQHCAFCCSAVNWDLSAKITKYGDNCFIELMKEIYSHLSVETKAFLNNKKRAKRIAHAPVLHFHNLKYDSCFVMKQITSVINVVEKGNKILSLTGFVKLGHFQLPIKCKDTLGLLSCALDDVISNYWPRNEQAAMFKRFDKQWFPYDRLKEYGAESNRSCVVSLEKDVYDKEQQHLEKGKRKYFPFVGLFDGCLTAEEFISKANEVNLWQIINKDNIVDYTNKTCTIDLEKYCGFYCERDCELLCMAWKQAQKLFLGTTPIDVERPESTSPLKASIDEELTIPGLSFSFFRKECFSKKTDGKQIYGFTGALRQYEQQGIRGGRCMTRDNESWWIKKDHMKLQDFDAVSLYPSAVKRLYCFLGKPKRLPEEFRNKSAEYLLSHTPAFDGFTVTCLVKKINKPLHFPLLSYKDKVKGCCWTNDARPTEPIVLNEINIQDLIDYQQAEIEVIDGYVWNEGKDFTCQSAIQNLFDFRVAAKKVDNPVQNAVKLVMNSAYGKSVMKMIKTEKEYIDIRHIDGHLNKNFYKVQSWYKINEEMYCVEHAKEYFSHKKDAESEQPFPNWWGARILAMSKRIMAEVMCLAEDLKVMIFYTDTDSMQIEASGLTLLAEEFNRKYGRTLIGNQMGQFHSDFVHGDIEKVLYATEGIYVTKKIYMARIVGPAKVNGELIERFHAKLKGVPERAIREYEGGVSKLYETLFLSSKAKDRTEMTGDLIERTHYIDPVVLPLTFQQKGQFIFSKTKEINTKWDITRKVANGCKTRNTSLISENGLQFEQIEKTLEILGKDVIVSSSR